VRYKQDTLEKQEVDDEGGRGWVLRRKYINTSKQVKGRIVPPHA
jgi:hypothetical protein